MPANDLNRFSADIAELRVTTDRLQKSQDSVLDELRGIGVRMLSVVELSTELREYRKTLHDRFRHITEIISENRIDIDDATKETKERFEKLDASFRERRVLIDGQLKEQFDKIDHRLRDHDRFVTMWTERWKTYLAIGAMFVTLLSSVVGAWLQNLLHLK